MARGFLLVILIGVLAVFYDLLGHIVVFQQGFATPLPPVVYWIAKFLVVFVAFTLGFIFLRGVLFAPILLVIVAAFAFGVIWEFTPVGEYSYSILLHLFHIPAIFAAVVTANLVKIFVPAPKTVALIVLLTASATIAAIAVLSWLGGY